MSLPSGFCELSTALRRQNGTVNIMGVVTDFMPPSSSRGDHLMMTLSIADSTFGSLSQTGDTGLKIRLFRPDMAEMPPVSGTGDVIVVTGAKMKDFRGEAIAISYADSSRWTLVAAASIPRKEKAGQLDSLPSVKQKGAPVLTKQQALYIVELHNLNDKIFYTSNQPVDRVVSNVGEVPSSSSQTKRDKFSLIKDLEVSTFSDLLGQVVKVFARGDRVELYVTDYTRNSLLWNYDPEFQRGPREGDEFGYLSSKSNHSEWPGPWGHLTLTITLWTPHSTFAQHEVSTGDFVDLRNVHLKFSGDSKLEGVLHTNRWHPDKVDISIVKNHSDERLKELLRRKYEYWKRRPKKCPGFDSIEALNALTKSEEGVGSDSAIPATSKQAKRKRKRGGDHEESLANSLAQVTKNKPTRSDGKALSQLSSTGFNPNLRCNHHTIPTRPLSSIMSSDHHQNTTPQGNVYTLPFQNVKSRAAVRIVDFFPSRLEDFAVFVPRPEAEFAILSDQDDDFYNTGDEDIEDLSDQENQDLLLARQSIYEVLTSSQRQLGPRWEWRFRLTLEDASTGTDSVRMEVLVVGEDAEFLLKLDASNLRRKPKDLAALREKLFLLWGDIEEQKMKALNDGEGLGSSRPFECCLKEYGIRAPLECRNGDTSELEPSKTAVDRKWERRWRMWGCTIV